MRLLKLTFVAATLSGCASVAGYKSPETIIVPSSSFENPGRTIRKNNELLFSQKFLAKNTAELTEPLVKTYTQGIATVSIKMNAGDRLFKVYGGSDVELYCTFKTTMNIKNKLGLDLDTQNCLSDTDGDGRFDKFFQNVDNIGYYSRLSPTLVSEIPRDFPTVSYVKSGIDKNVFVRGGLRIQGAVFFNPTIQLVLERRAGNYQVYSSEMIKLKKSDTYPRDVEMLGAKVRVYSVTTDSVEYEIIEGFPQDKLYRLRAQE